MRPNSGRGLIIQTRAHSSADDASDRIPPVERTSNESLQAAVLTALRDAIVQGRLEPGARYFENDLAHRLGVSRTPLREALRALEAQGLVLFTEGRRGFEVVDPVDDAAVVYEIRQRLEGLAARLAAAVITVPELDALTGIQTRMMAIIESPDPATRLEELAELNGQFHSRVSGACRRPRLISLIEQLSPIYISRQIVMLYSDEERRHSFEEHAEILAALWARDGDRAERLIHAHLKGGQRFMLGDDTT